MKLLKILQSAEFFNREQTELFSKEPTYFYEYLNDHQEIAETITLALDNEELKKVREGMFSQSTSCKLVIGNEMNYIHAITIPIIQYNHSDNKDANKAVFVNNAITKSCCAEITAILNNDNVATKCVPFIIPIQSIFKYKSTFIKPFTDSIKNDLVQMERGHQSEKDLNTIALINDIGLDKSTLTFNYDMFNLSVFLIFTLSKFASPLPISEQNLIDIEDSLSHQYSTIIDGYKNFVHAPTSPEFFSIIEICSTITVCIDKLDLFSSLVSLTVSNISGVNVSVSITVQDNTHRADENTLSFRPILKSYDFKIVSPHKLKPEYVLNNIKDDLLLMNKNITVISLPHIMG